MHVILVPVGSSGDVLPHIAIGQRLRARGADVTVLTNEVFESQVTHAGLTPARYGTRQQYEALTKHPDLWHPTKSAPFIMRQVFSETDGAIRALDPLVRRDSVVISGSLGFAGRIAAEKVGARQVVVHLQPSVLFSVYHTPVLPSGRALPWIPILGRRALFFALDRLLLDRKIRRPLDDLRIAHGLSPIQERIIQWWSRADLVLGLFPEWFAPPQPDWPPNVRLTGFPLFGGDVGTPLSADLESFLDHGTKPVAISPGSANRQADRYITTAIGALLRLGRRGLILTPYAEQVPPLPDGFLHVNYAAFERVLPRCAALIHHGGIGTLSQALAAGIPQLIHPLAFDQPDNALRVTKLGVGQAIPPRSFTVSAVHTALERLLSDSLVDIKVKELAGRLAGADPLSACADLIEAVAK